MDQATYSIEAYGICEHEYGSDYQPSAGLVAGPFYALDRLRWFSLGVGHFMFQWNRWLNNFGLCLLLARCMQVLWGELRLWFCGNGDWGYLLSSTMASSSLAPRLELHQRMGHFDYPIVVTTTLHLSPDGCDYNSSFSRWL